MKNRTIGFIEKSKEIYNNYYDYSLVNYINNKTKVIIICPIHGKFEQVPNSHLKGYGCKLCGYDKKKLKKEDVINKLNIIHNNRYDYKLLNFNKNNDKVKIICPIHGEFEQILSDHLNGSGCKKCSYNININNLNDFIEKSKEIHNNKYDYSLVDYKNNKTKVKIICPIHGEFEQTPLIHINGHGCKLCGYDNLKSNLNKFIEKSNIIHNNYYNYDKSNYNGSNNKILIKCPIHGEFEQRAAGHLQGFGCYKCNISKGEKEVKKYLITNNILFKEQKVFNDCKNINNLKFDFYLPKLNICIEYDGEYHYKNIFNNDEYLKQQYRDKIKNEYCLKNNIKLIRIPYYDFNNIENILNEKILNNNNKNILYKVDSSGKYSKESYLKINYIDLYNDILLYSVNNNIENIAFNEKVYCYKHNIIPPTCNNPNCNNVVKFKNSTIGYKKYCSIKCISSDPNIKEIKKNKSLEKFGTKTPAESNIIKEKTKRTNLKKYGFVCSLQNEEIQKKSKLTLLNNYGVDNPQKSKEIQEKRIMNFDVTKWRENFERTMILRYGVKNALQNKDIKIKVKKTNFKKYGKDNVNKIDHFIKKRLITKQLKWKDNLLKNNNIIDIDLQNRQYNMLCDCGKDHEFNISFSLYKSRKQFATKYCTVCFPPYKNNISQLETDLFDFIKNNYENEIILNTKKIISPYELDIYLPDLNLAFEFNGVYWHNELNKPNDYHKMKSDLCDKNNIQLIHIYEDNWVYKQDIVKSMILNKLKKTPNKIFARKCEIKEIDNKLVREFLNNNHIQGYVNSSVKIGLFFEDKLVSLMTFGKGRKSLNTKNIEGEYEMLRFCNKLNTNVIGGASRLFNYFLKKYNPIQIVSYADRGYSNGNLYKQIGFDLTHITEPNYYYVVDDIRIHRFNFRKDILIKEGFDKNKSEHDIMLERKIYRIYNSGNFKFIFFNKRYKMI